MSEDIIKLLVKSIGETLSELEQKKLNGWLSDGEKNRKLYKHVSSFFTDKKSVPQMEAAGQETVRKIILDRIALLENKEWKKAGRNHYWQWNYRSIAAIAVLTISVAVALLFGYQKSEEITYTEFYTPLGEKMTIVLPDSTEVRLNSGTHLRYASDFGKSGRMVWVDGEAYFDVKKQNGKLFKVKTEAMEITVRGTIFNIRSYKDDNEMIAQLYQGVVDLNLPAIKQELTMNVGDKVIYDVRNGNFQIEKSSDSDCSWLRGEYKFYNERLGTLVNMLNRVFKADICFKDNKLKDDYYTGTILEEKGLGRILHLLEISADIRVIHEGEKIYLDK